MRWRTCNAIRDLLESEAYVLNMEFARVAERVARMSGL